MSKQWKTDWRDEWWKDTRELVDKCEHCRWSIGNRGGSHPTCYLCRRNLTRLDNYTEIKGMVDNEPKNQAEDI